MQIPNDIASLITPFAAMAATAATAGGSGDATEVDGITIDLDAGTRGRRFNALVFVLLGQATLAEGETLTLTANLQDAEDDGAGSPTDWADITTPAVALTLTGGTGGSTERGAAKIGFDLRNARRYVRVQVTPDLSAANTDTAAINAAAILANPDLAPAD